MSNPVFFVYHSHARGWLLQSYSEHMVRETPVSDFADLLNTPLFVERVNKGKRVEYKIVPWELFQ